MAKKENKSIGYLALSVIPLIGIAWAAIAGKLHDGYLKKCIATEDNFEVYFVEKLNELNLSSSTERIGNYVVTDSPSNISNINITSIRPIAHDVHLDWDPIYDSSYPNKSFTIEVKGNPITKVNETDEQEYELTFEFFINFDVYENFAEYYNKDLIQVLGTQDYTYLTYYKNNPRNCPIVALKKYFDDYYKNVCFYEYKEDIIVGNSASVIVDLISEVDRDLITADSKTQFDRIANLYKLLSSKEQQNVTNYSLLADYIKVCEAKICENKIKLINDTCNSGDVPSDIEVEECRTAYNKLDAEYKSLVTNLSQLEYIETNLDYLKFMKRFNDLASMDKVNDKKNYYSKIKSMVSTYYNKLSAELQSNVSKEVYDQMVIYVAEYNSADNNDSTKKELKIEDKNK